MKRFLRHLLFGAVWIGIGVALMLYSPQLGAITMLAGTSFALLRAVRRPLPIRLLPLGVVCLVALVAWRVQVGAGEYLLSSSTSVVFVVGAAIGLVRGRGQALTRVGGVVMARAPQWHLAAWTATLLFTQACLLFGWFEVRELALTLTHLSVGVLIGVSATLIIRGRKGGIPAAGPRAPAPATLWIPLLLIGVTSAYAQVRMVQSAQDAADIALTASDVGLPAWHRKSPERLRRAQGKLLAMLRESEVLNPMEAGIGYFTNAPTVMHTGYPVTQMALMAYRSASLSEREFSTFRKRAGTEASLTFRRLRGVGDNAAVVGDPEGGASGLLQVGPWVCMVHYSDDRDNGVRGSPVAKVSRFLGIIARRVAGLRLPGMEAGGGSVAPPPDRGDDPPIPGTDGGLWSDPNDPTHHPTGEGLSYDDYLDGTGPFFGAGTTGTASSSGGAGLDFSNPAVPSGIVLALTQVLAAAALSAAASGTASAATAAASTTPGTRHLYGDEARAWLEDNDWVNDDGTFTDDYKKWRDAPISQGNDEDLHHIQFGDTSPDQDGAPADESSDRLPDGEVGIIITDHNGPRVHSRPAQPDEIPDEYRDPAPPPDGGSSTGQPPKSPPTKTPPVTPPPVTPPPVVPPIDPPKQPDEWWPTDGPDPDTVEETEPEPPERPDPPKRNLRPELPHAGTRVDFHDFTLDMQKLAAELKARGHYNINPWLDQDPTLIAHGLRTLGSSILDRVCPISGVRQGLTCQGYVEASKDRVLEIVQRIYGDDPRVTVSIVDFEEKSSVSPGGFFDQFTLDGALDDYVDSYVPMNHTLFRVRTSDGKQYALDFWDQARGGPLIQDWDESVAQWKDGIGGLHGRDFHIARSEDIRFVSRRK